MPRPLSVAVATVLALGAAAPAVATAAQPPAPGAPGQHAVWTPADKEAFGTSATTASKVWFTLEHGRMTEVFYPDLGTPSVRDLQFAVSDGKTFATRETDAQHTVALADPRSLTYTQTTTAPQFRLTKTYVADPARSTVMLKVRFESLVRKPLALYVLYDPSLDNDGDDDTGTTSGTALVAGDGHVASALTASPAFAQTSSGYLGTSDGWTDLASDFRMDWSYDAPAAGNVVQTARTALTGQRGSQDLVLALGFGASGAAATDAATASLAAGFADRSTAYAAGWHAYLAGLKPEPASAAPYGALYDVSAMTLAAHEDKTFHGAYVASPTMPWAWGTGLDDPSDAYHLVWSRDLYQIATALLAAGDRAGADRAVDFLFGRQQKPDGSFPQNSRVDGTPQWTNTQLDEVAMPIVLAWQLGRRDAGTWAHVKAAADYVLANGPVTLQERWENQGGYSPATIAAEIAGLVCAADLARANGDAASAARYDAAADKWQRNVEGWTATPNGPYAPRPYYLRLTKDARPDLGTSYDIGDSGPAGVDQRAVVDPSFLELVRLGVKPASDPVVANTIKVVDAQLAVDTANGVFWHRYNGDGYGETRTGAPWDIGFPAGSQTTIGRVWPIFAGERGEYELAAGGSATARLASIAGAANAGLMIPEQVWDDNPPAGRPGFPSGEGTLSATPLAWSHAQFMRLAWSIQAGRPIETASIVACRYAGCG